MKKQFVAIIFALSVCGLLVYWLVKSEDARSNNGAKQSLLQQGSTRSEPRGKIENEANKNGSSRSDKINPQDILLNGLSRSELLTTARTFSLRNYREYLKSVINADIEGGIKYHMICIASRRMGQSNMLDAAQKAIEAELGVGRLRAEAIKYLYGSLPRSYKEVTDSIEKWKESSDRDAAAVGLIEWSRKQQNEIVVSLLTQPTTQDVHGKYLLEGLLGKMTLLSSKTLRLDLFENVIQSLKESKIINSDLGQKFIVRSSSYLPFESWRVWQQEFHTFPPANHQDQLLRSMHGASVERTLAAVMKDWPADSKNPHAVNNFLRKAVETGLKQDSAQVMKWYEENKATLSPTVSDGVSEPIAKKLTMEKKFDEAQKWVDQLTNESLKGRSIRGMAQFRTADVREQVKKDPQATVEGLQSENHLETPILIGVAVNEWLNKDPDEAGKWFFDNSKNMGAAERDYSAEAFVKYGIKVGDLDAARQWADQHSSEEKRSQYLKQIDHAAVEQKYK